MRYRPATAQMAEAKAIVAVNEHPFVMTTIGHTGLLNLPMLPHYCIAGDTAK